MESFYTFSRKVGSRSVVEIRPAGDVKFSDVDQYLRTTSRYQLQNDVLFEVARGCKWTDIIYYHGAAHLKFYSKKMVDILNNFVNLEGKMYPIKIINDVIREYYVLYNLDTFQFLNKKEMLNGEKYALFKLPTDIPNLFTLTNSNMCICSQALKDALEHQKITNIEFSQYTYGLSQMEYIKWKNGLLIFNR